MVAKQLDRQLPTSLFKGLQINPSVLSAVENSATLCSNVEKNFAGQLTTRKGIKTVYHNLSSDGVSSFGCMFPITYTYHDTDTGGTVEEQVALLINTDTSFAITNINLQRLREHTLTITYVGTGTGRIQFYPEQINPTTSYATQWRIKLTDQTGIVYNQALVTAEASARTGIGRVQGLVTAIHALASFNCSPSSISASADESPVDVFGPWIDESLTNAQTLELTYYDISAVNGNDLDIPPRAFTDANFILPSFNNFNNVLDIAYGEYLVKYDGQACYRSGLPGANIYSIGDSSGGSAFVAGDVFIYKVVYERIDNRGNIITGEDSDDTLDIATHTMVANRNIDFYAVNLQSSIYPKFYLRVAVIDGLQTSVTTIAVDSGHSIAPDDYVFFYDAVSAANVSRLATAVTAASITIAGAAVTVADNDIISNNVKIQIWRTKANGTDFYFVKELANDAANPTRFFEDSTSDDDLIEPYIPQLRKHSEPTKCSFVGEHQGLRIIAGDSTHPNRVSWSLPEDTEAFPLESNNADIQGGGLGAVTGFGTVDDDALAIFKTQGHVIVEGSLDDLNIRQLNRANTGIGCTSFKTLQRIGDSDALMGLSLRGPFLFNGRVPSLAVSEGIRPFFNNLDQAQVNGTTIPEDVDLNATVGPTYLTQPTDLDVPLVLQRAVAIADTLNYRYHLFIPAEVGNPGGKKYPMYPSCRWLVFHYDTGDLVWTEHTFYNRYRELGSAYGSQNVVPNCGFAFYKKQLWYGMFVYRLGPTLNDMRSVIGHFKNDGDKYDYSDDSYPIYIDLHYNPITREPGSPSAFFKPLFVNIYKFLSNRISDPVRTIVTADYGLPFNIVVRLVKDFKHFVGSSLSTRGERTFNPVNGTTSIRVKAVTDKCRAAQIKISNEEADPIDFEQVVFDNVEFIYAMPYDKQSKDPKSRG